MSKKTHDTIATRLSIVLTKFNNGERVTIDELATEFGVTKRTIQRDINERLANIPIKKEKGVYFLENHHLGKVTFDDIYNFASFSGIDKMFPSFGKEFSQHLLDKNVTQAYLIKTHNFENISHRLLEFKKIEKSIINKTMIELVYANKKRRVEPYKLANVKGIWYVVALQDSVIKTFTFSKISELQKTEQIFTLDFDILKEIENDESIWFSNKKSEVILKVNAYASQFFKRRKVMAYQKILEEYPNGSLLVSTQMTFEDEVLQLVRAMIPNISIVSPIELQEKLDGSLKLYLSTK
jgi:predicted DNA-binding transcriptional regulator YafY